MIFFPTYAIYDAAADTWSVDLHVWAYRVAARSTKRDALAKVFRRALGLPKEHASAAVYQRRAAMFLVDAIRQCPVAVALGGLRFDIGATKKSGHLEATLDLPGPLVREHAQSDGTLRFAPVGLDLPVGVTARLVEPQGLSVISDIDDTIKASYVWKKRKLIRTTFAREWKPTKGLGPVYQRLADAGAAFHYVSTSPWQLYPSLAQFTQRAGFPEGTFHLKRFRWKDRSFLDLFANAEKYKPRLIEPILERFPQRRFVLIGDSGECDPQVYGRLARQRPGQVAAILIRDVAGLGADDPAIVEAFAGLDRSVWQMFDKAKRLDVDALLARIGTHEGPPHLTKPGAAA